MIRWTSTRPSPPLERWQSREQILKAHLDSLSPDELRRVRADYYWLRFGQKAWLGKLARKANFDPNQPRDDHGRWVDAGGDQDNSADGRQSNDPVESFAAARRRGRSAAYCMAQYAIDGLMCNSVKPKSRQAACWKQAAERLGNCLAGRPIPPLNF
jgi:hypothetical protein